MKTFLSSSSTRTSARSSGFTVIEVLVALVILLIGGLAIMNLFPPAFNVIRGSENREVAMSQVKGSLARYSNDPASIPDAIYDNSGGGWTDAGNASVEGSRSRNASLPQIVVNDDAASETNYGLSALGHFKHIVGERHKVISYTDTTVVPPVTHSFVLLNYAYAYTAPMATAGNPKVSTAETIEGARVDETGKLNFEDAVYASDGVSLPSPPQPGIYYASYSWQNPVPPSLTANGPLQSITDELVDMNPATPGDFRVFQPARAGARVVAGPIQMKAFFPKPLPPTVPPTVPVVNPDAPFRGFLPVDPNLKGREVVVDYDVLDWRWLVEDNAATVPTSKINPVVPQTAIDNGTARDVKLSIPVLGTPQPVSIPPAPALYALTMPAPDASGQIFFNARGGTWTPKVGRTGIVLNVDAASATYDIDDDSGNARSMIAPRVRTSYWASKGWAQQLSVAASSYYVFDGTRPAKISEKWREFYWRPFNNDGTTPNVNRGKLYFHSSEAGKTIMVSFTSGTARFANQIVTIGSRIVPAPTGVQFPNMTTQAAPGNEIFTPQSKVAIAELIDGSGNPIPADALTSVRGVSVRSRMAWQQGSNYTQEVAEMYRPLN